MECKRRRAALAQAIEPLKVGGAYHALSVAVLGSCRRNFAGGTAVRVNLMDASDSDPRAARLFRILEQYAGVLTQVERDLLACLRLFPRGVRVEIPGWIVQAGDAVAGTLIGLADRELAGHREKTSDAQARFSLPDGCAGDLLRAPVPAATQDPQRWKLQNQR